MCFRGPCRGNCSDHKPGPSTLCTVRADLVQTWTVKDQDLIPVRVRASIGLKQRETKHDQLVHSPLQPYRAVTPPLWAVMATE